MDDDMQDSDGWLTRLYNLKGSDWVPITTGQLRLTNVPVRSAHEGGLLEASHAGMCLLQRCRD